MKTEIAFILDRSGSMSSMKHAAIAGFNEFLAAQKTTVDDAGRPIPATFSLILFDHEYLPVHNREDIQTALPLDDSTYTPRGSTALLDAIGRTIDTIGAQIEATPFAERPTKVIVAILTDGAENASRRHTMQGIHQRITRMTEQHGWEFLFLGADQDAITTAARMGIQAKHASTWSANEDDLRASQKAFAMKIAASRRAESRCSMMPEELETLEESMEESLNKSRKKKE